LKKKKQSSPISESEEGSSSGEKQISRCIGNLHVTAEEHKDGNGLTFLYEVKKGPCDESFGINVAKMTGFPLTVVNEAKEKAIELEAFGKIGVGSSVWNVVPLLNEEAEGKENKNNLKVSEEEVEKLLAGFVSDVVNLRTTLTLDDRKKDIGKDSVEKLKSLKDKLDRELGKIGVKVM